MAGNEYGRCISSGHDKWRMSTEDGEASVPEIRWRRIDQGLEITLRRVPGRSLAGRGLPELPMSGSSMLVRSY